MTPGRSAPAIYETPSPLSDTPGEDDEVMTRAPADDAPVEPAQSLGDPELHPDPAITDPGAEAPIAEGGEQA